MADDPDPPSDRFAELLARTTAPSSDPAGDCPDPGLLAGFAEGRLAERRVAAVSEHLVSCEACRVAVAAAAADAREEPAAVRPLQPARPIRGIRPWMIGAAAAAIVAAAFIVSRRGGDDAGTTRETLVAAAHDLAQARPDLFAGFEPLQSGETVAGTHGPMRGALALHHPAGKVLETRPAFRWDSVPGVAKWRVALRTAAGETIWSAESSEPSLAYPTDREALRPGTRYMWEVFGDGPRGTDGSRRVFDVASGGEREAFDEITRVVDARAPERIRPLVLAHVALRRGLPARAAAEAERFLASSPGDAAGEDALAIARRALGEIDGSGAK